MDQREKIKTEIIEWAKALISSIVIVGLIMFFVRPTLVKGDSMYPTIKEYNYLIIEKVTYRSNEPERGDIIVFKSSLDENRFKKKDLIKRVIGIEGDHVVISDGLVYVNNEALEEGYINSDYTFGEVDVNVPEDAVFVLGDNRAISRDSRDPAVGFVDLTNVRGRIFVRLFPFNKMGNVE